MRWRETIVQKDSDAAEFDSHDRKNYGWLKFEILWVSAKIPLRDLSGQCQGTDWIGLW
jgi:hypothetical protein